MTPFITALTDHPHWRRNAILAVTVGPLFVFLAACFAAVGG
jgi:hypothetical protein